MKIHDPEWKVTVALIRAAEELRAVQQKMWNELGCHVPNWSDDQFCAYQAMSRARVELHEAAIKSMPPGGTFDDYAEIVLSIHIKGAPT